MNSNGENRIPTPIPLENDNKYMSNEFIPIVIPITIPITYNSQQTIATPLVQRYQYKEVNDVIYSKCRGCHITYIRNEKEKGGAKYFRCNLCNEHFLEKTLLSSCVIC